MKEPAAVGRTKAPLRDRDFLLGFLLTASVSLAGGLFGIARWAGWLFPIPESEWLARIGAFVLGIGLVVSGIFVAGAALYVFLRGGRVK